MGNEVRMSEEDAVDDEDMVSEWGIGLPSGDDLTPLSQFLIPSALAIAFSIVPERCRTIQEVDRASRNTLSSLRSSSNGSFGANASPSNAAVAVDEVDRVGSNSPGSDLKSQKKSDGGGEAVVDSMAAEEGDGDDSESEDPSGNGKAPKRPRLVWTPQLHKRFVDVVAHLGIGNAVPKTIMQLMNVQGLTRENVASHLQKYRLYLKRTQGLTADGPPSSSDQLFSSTPQSFQDGGSGNAPANGATGGKLGIPIPVPSMMAMPVYGHGYHHSNHGHDPYHQYRHHGNGVFESNPYKFGSMTTSPSVGGGGVNDK